MAKRHTIAWVLVALAVVIIIWLLTRARATAAPAVSITLPGFTIPGNNLTIGAAPQFPVTDYNLPPLPNVTVTGSCACPCTDGPTTIFPPDFGQAGAIAAAAIANASVAAYLKMFGYPIQVGATDATPVAWGF